MGGRLIVELLEERDECVGVAERFGKVQSCDDYMRINYVKLCTFSHRSIFSRWDGRRYTQKTVQRVNESFLITHGRAPWKDDKSPNSARGALCASGNCSSSSLAREDSAQRLVMKNGRGKLKKNQ